MMVTTAPPSLHASAEAPVFQSATVAELLRLASLPEGNPEKLRLGFAPSNSPRLQPNEHAMWTHKADGEAEGWDEAKETVKEMVLTQEMVRARVAEEWLRAGWIR